MELLTYSQPFAKKEGWLVPLAGVAFLLGALLTRRPEWLAQDKEPEGR
jgi:hypothetical protein